MRIGIFGGSFDPVHREHKNFVRAALKSLQLDKLIVMPAHTPPHKQGRSLSSNADRLAMCQLAFADLEKVEVSDFELSQGGTSYTYLTCAHVRQSYPNADIFFLVGTDMLRNFPFWKYPEKILEMVELAVSGREDEEGWWQREQEVFTQRFGKPFVKIDYNGDAVSSTQIRVLEGAGMRLDTFVEEKVADYIEEKGLYSIPFAKEALALEKPSRALHSVRVAHLAARRAYALHIPEQDAIAAGLLHDCAKNLPPDHPYLEGFTPPDEWGEVPASVWHQFAGAYVAERIFGVQNADILNAIRYHTSGRENMSGLEKLIFLADMLEEERHYEGVEILRELFWRGQDLDECLEEALYQTIEFLKSKNADIYPLTQNAYHFIKKEV
ncbi:MAG: nicotinate (nicotinamide) nucleotide adenylyltransferase [Clostridia bacterium]|nr:nicotinate (nicotinamide) nucleotide adenylyltransferase [Clostridia bacterium]